jgi:DNA-binding transcriptional regulator GbsR (MarR family)
MNAQLLEAEQFFVNQFGSLFGAYGYNSLVGRIIALLFINGGPLSLEEISKKLKISKPAVSKDIRIAINSGMVSRVHDQAFPHQAFFQAEHNFAEILNKSIVQRFAQKSDIIKQTLDKVQTPKSRPASAELEHLRHRLQTFLRVFEIVQEEYVTLGQNVEKRLNKLLKKV